MKLANLAGRATIVTAATGIDVAAASDGRFGPEMADVYEQWAAFREWATSSTDVTDAVTVPFDESALDNPSPTARQVFGIGLNYRAHANETGRDVSSVPATFTKFSSCLSGPFDDIVVTVPTVDWEVELVVVIGVEARNVAAADGWSHVAGLAVGQDISDRTLQYAAGNQFSLGKSRPGFGPIGPLLVTPDEFDNADDLRLTCSIDGEVMQDGRTSDLVFDVCALVAELSSVLTLLPGDVIFTGTPAGVGAARKPPRFLKPGEVLETTIEGIGTMRNHIVGP